ncbi:MAG: hypothetical protein ACK4MG_04090 [Aquabacterium sp.]
MARRTITLNVDVGNVDVDVDLRDIPTEDLLEELEIRRTGKDQDDASTADSSDDELFRIDRMELQAIRQLYLTGRELEASHRASTLIGELLGTALY